MPGHEMDAPALSTEQANLLISYDRPRQQSMSLAVSAALLSAKVREPCDDDCSLALGLWRESTVISIEVKRILHPPTMRG